MDCAEFINGFHVSFCVDSVTHHDDSRTLGSFGERKRKKASLSQEEAQNLCSSRTARSCACLLYSSVLSPPAAGLQRELVLFGLLQCHGYYISPGFAHFDQSSPVFRTSFNHLHSTPSQQTKMKGFQVLRLVVAILVISSSLSLARVLDDGISNQKFKLPTLPSCPPPPESPVYESPPYASPSPVYESPPYSPSPVYESPPSPTYSPSPVYKSPTYSPSPVYKSPPSPSYSPSPVYKSPPAGGY
uniref:Uncharacterized protein n=1 Tax=Physcomitrium patens TaxID=3218 RepID=A0A2K1IAJ8_PHYPA|nr:hypothetical protein PHYPA_030871 [Physcomitrium patens]